MTQVYASQTDRTANVLGENFTATQNNLLAAYALKEGENQTEIDKLAEAMKLQRAVVTDANGTQRTLPFTVRGVQLVAEQRFQHSSQIVSLFSNLLDKIDQMKQRLISKFGQG